MVPIVGTCERRPTRPAADGPRCRSRPPPAPRPSAPGRGRSAGCPACRRSPARRPGPARCRHPPRCGGRRYAGPRCLHVEVEQGVAGQRGQHMVEEAHAGGQLRPAGAVQLEAERMSVSVVVREIVADRGMRRLIAQFVRLVPPARRTQGGAGASVMASENRRLDEDEKTRRTKPALPGNHGQFGANDATEDYKLLEDHPSPERAGRLKARSRPMRASAPDGVGGGSRPRAWGERGGGARAAGRRAPGRRTAGAVQPSGPGRHGPVVGGRHDAGGRHVQHGAEGQGERAVLGAGPGRRRATGAAPAPTRAGRWIGGRTGWAARRPRVRRTACAMPVSPIRTGSRWSRPAG